MAEPKLCLHACVWTRSEHTDPHRGLCRSPIFTRKMLVCVSEADQHTTAVPSTVHRGRGNLKKKTPIIIFETPESRGEWQKEIKLNETDWVNQTEERDCQWKPARVSWPKCDVQFSWILWPEGAVQLGKNQLGIKLPGANSRARNSQRGSSFV